MKLLNVTMSKSTSLKEREELRDKYYKDLLKDFPDEELVEQINIYLKISNLDGEILSKKDQLIQFQAEIKEYTIENSRLSSENSGLMLTLAEFKRRIAEGSTSTDTDITPQQQLNTSSSSISSGPDQKDLLKSIMLKKSENIGTEKKATGERTTNFFGFEYMPDDRLRNVIQSVMQAPTIPMKDKISNNSANSTSGTRGARGGPVAGRRGPAPVKKGTEAPTSGDKSDGVDKLTKSPSKMLTLRLKNIAKTQDTIFENIGPAKDVDLDVIRENFTEIEKVKSTPRIDNNSNTQTKQKESLIDGRRQQQLGIFLSRLKVSPEDLVEALKSITLIKETNSELLELLMGIFSPKFIEVEYPLFQNYKGEIDDLSASEKFLFKLYKVNRIYQRLEILSIQSTLNLFINEADEDQQTINIGIEKLKSEEFKTLLSFIVEIANTLTNSSRKTIGFQFSSLPQLTELRSPVDKNMTVLHFLVQLLSEKYPDAVSFASQNLPKFTDAAKAIANFQSFFPKMLKKLHIIEMEYQSTPLSDKTYKTKLREIKESLLTECSALTLKLHNIDNLIVFLGDFQNNLPENSTVNALKKLWMELKEINMFSSSDCQTRAKRDEERYMFFVVIEEFLRNMTKAQAYVEAIKLKKIQKEALAKKLNDEGTQIPSTPRKDDNEIENNNNKDEENSRLKANTLGEKNNNNSNSIIIDDYNPTTPSTPIPKQATTEISIPTSKILSESHDSKIRFSPDNKNLIKIKCHPGPGKRASQDSSRVSSDFQVYDIHEYQRLKRSSYGSGEYSSILNNLQAHSTSPSTSPSQLSTNNNNSDGSINNSDNNGESNKRQFPVMKKQVL